MRCRVLLVLCVAFSAFSFVGWSADVTVSYLGHSCFTLRADDGPVILLDPYGSYVEYPGLPVPADIVLMTHAHIDHCPDCYGETDRVEGDPIKVFLLDDDGRCREKIPPASWMITPAFKTHAIEGNHVTKSGGGQGWVCMFSFELGGLQFAHLGDLGRTLSAAQIDALENVDVLFIPVGGEFTLDAIEAMTVISQLPSVKVVLPMHYYVEGHTPWTSMAPLDPFVALAEEEYTVREFEDFSVELSPETIPRSVEVWVLEYKPD